ncbi:hypothetical protein IAU60_003883 [Kwoniella sp. DSM 27419]
MLHLPLTLRSTFIKLRRSTSYLALRGSRESIHLAAAPIRLAPSDPRCLHVSTPSAISGPSTIRNKCATPGLGQPCPSRPRLTARFASHRSPSATFSTSSCFSAQPLPDDSWDFDSYRYQPPPPPPRRSHESSRPSQQSLQSSTLPARPPPLSSSKGKEREVIPILDSSPPGSLRKIIDGPDIPQGNFEPTPNDIDELFWSTAASSSSGQTALGLEDVDTAWLGDLDGRPGGQGWDIPAELYSELGLDGPMPEMPAMEDFSDPFAAPTRRRSSDQQRTVTTPADPRHTGSDVSESSTADPRLLPPLNPPANPPADMTRFDWRSRSLSQTRQPKSSRRRRWFPDLPVRKAPAWDKLGMGDQLREELDRYQRHFIPLLEAEHAEEKRLYEERLADWTVDRLQREGYTMDEMRAAKGYQPKSLVGVGTVYSFVRGKGERELPFHRFTIGSNVVLSRTDPHIDPVCPEGSKDQSKPLVGSVWNVSKGNLRIMFNEDIPEIDRGNWRLDIGCSDFAIKRQIEAIKSLNLDPFQQDMQDFIKASEQVAQSDVTADASDVPAWRKHKKEQTVLRGTTVRDLLFRSFQADYHPDTFSSAEAAPSLPIPLEQVVPDPSEMQPSDLDAVPQPPLPATQTPSILADNQMINSWTKRYRRPGTPIRVEGDPHVLLNESQTRAIAMMLSERLSLVQGPPGTGKTRVIIETIKLLKQHWQIPHPILVTAHTNVAVDNLLSGLRAHGVKAVRFGAINRVAEDSSDFTLDRLMGLHPGWWDLESARKEREELFERKNKGILTADEDARLGKLSQKIWVLRQNITRDVLLDADVVCTTCLSATSNTLQGIDFPIVFLDEASMATEPLSLVPLTKGSAHVAIIGDHKQLPPVIVSPDAHTGGLATSLFERLIHEGHVPSIMLDTQYRMHPLLATFPSETFYSSLLKNGTDPDRLSAPETAFLMPQAEDEDGGRKSLTFLNHDHPESPVSKSLANYGDAEIVCDVVADLLYKNPTLKGSQIGLITPYLSQIRLLTTHLRDPERREAFIDVLGSARAREIDEIEIRTVDGFEGREKEVIVFSTVRSNVGGWIGFLGDWRRVNVGLTRARRALIMVGSKATLSQARIGKKGEETLPSGGAKVWRDLMEWLDKEDMVMDVE